MDDRERILSGLNPSESSAGPVVGNYRLVYEAGASWDAFTARLAELGGRVIWPEGGPIGPMILRTLDDFGIPARNAFVDDDVSEVIQLASTADIWTADVGITMADLAVAETGSLLLSAGPGRARMASLAPPTHVAVVHEDRLVATLEDALAHRLARTSVLIAGPSRTADIEGVLVRGVHGPKELIVVVVRGY